jgi:hypothetical protein
VSEQERLEPTIDFTAVVFGEPPPALPPPIPLDYAHPRIASPRKKSGYIGAHWRGELPLAQSYWANVFLVGVVLIMLEATMIPLLRAQHLSLTNLLILIAIYTPIRLAITVWQVVGTFRSAALSGSGWAVVVNILMIFVVLGAIGSGIGTAKNIQMIAHAAAEQRSLSDFKIGLAPDGKGILAKGTMGIGFADAVQAAFAQHPEQHRLLLDSRGGDIDNGMQLHDYLAAHGDIVVEVDHLCASACTLAFVGASQRLVGPAAEMGFHQMRSIVDSSYSRHMVDTEQESFKGYMSKLGASRGFIDMAFAKQGEDVWVPDGDTLFANHIITGVAIDDRIIGEREWHSEQFLYAYRKEPTMRTIGVAFEHLRVQQPGLFDAWTERNRAIMREATRTQRIESYRGNLWRTLRSAHGRRRQRTGSGGTRVCRQLPRPAGNDTRQGIAADLRSFPRWHGRRTQAHQRRFLHRQRHGLWRAVCRAAGQPDRRARTHDRHPAAAGAAPGDPGHAACRRQYGRATLPAADRAARALPRHAHAAGGMGVAQLLHPLSLRAGPASAGTYRRRAYSPNRRPAPR